MRAAISIVRHAGPHLRPAILLQGADGSPALLLSSSRREVRLWDVAAMDGGPACGWDDCRGGHFNHAGTVVVAVSSRQSRCQLVSCSGHITVARLSRC